MGWEWQVGAEGRAAHLVLQLQWQAWRHTLLFRKNIPLAITDKLSPTHLHGLPDLEAKVVCRDGRLHNLTCTQQQYKSSMQAGSGQIRSWAVRRPYANPSSA